MLVIRNEQMWAFRMAMGEQFVDKLMLLFRGLWPARTARLGDNYRRVIESSIDRALSYGIKTESSVARFVNLCLTWGPDFELQPQHEWALKILKDPNLRGPLKINELAFGTKLRLAKQPPA
jgi:hypothetical protein